MEFGTGFTAGATLLVGAISFFVGEQRARRQLSSELEAKRWAEIMMCIRTVESETEPQLLKMACRQRMRELAFDLIEPSGPVRPPSGNVHLGLDPRSPAPDHIGVDYTIRPSWERLSPADQRARYWRVFGLSLATAAAAAGFAVASQGVIRFVSGLG